MSKYKFKITYRNENEHKLDAIAKNDYRMHKNILEWKADEIIEEKDKETQRFKCIGNAWTVDIITHIFSYLPMEYRIGE